MNHRAILLLAAATIGSLAVLVPIDCQCARAADNEDVVLYAAGAVEVRVPPGWKAYQIAFGREVRLVLSPDEVESVRRMPPRGIWFSAHVHRDSADIDDRQLVELLNSRLRLATDDEPEAAKPEQIDVAGRRGVRQSFSHAAQTSDSTQPEDSKKGFHMLLRMDWGILEIHAVVPVPDSDEQFASLTSLVKRLAFHPPKTAQFAAHEKRLSDAQLIFGTWKAFRSRLKILPGRRIVIQPDPRRVVAIDDPKFPDEDGPTKRLTGKFRSEDDILYVEWDDGSRSNFRWRLRGEDLLLTDHDGHVSQLRRILE